MLGSMNLRHAFLLLLSIWAGGCAGSEDVVPAPLVDLGTAIASWPGPDFRVTQLVTSGSGDNARKALFTIEVIDSTLVMVAVTPVGLPLFQARADRNGVDLTSVRMIDEGMKPEWILADFVLTFWPAQLLAGALPNEGYRIEDSEFARTIKAPDGSPVVSIRYALPTTLTDRLRGEAHLINHQLSYELTVKTLTLEGIE